MKTSTKPTSRTHVLNRGDFTQYAQEIGIWFGLCEDHGVDAAAEEIEITVTAVKKVA